MNDTEIRANRQFLKDTLRLQIDFSQTDQHRGINPPPVQKPLKEGQKLTPLPDPESFTAFRGTDLVDAIGQRRSWRRFLDQSLSLAELSWLLWATQGITEVIAPGCARRTVPSAGCRHAFESYLLINNVESLEKGVHRYLSSMHWFSNTRSTTSLPNWPRRRLDKPLSPGRRSHLPGLPSPTAWSGVTALLPIGSSPWTRGTSARISTWAAQRFMQTCAIAAYHQDMMDQLLKVDGEDEYTVYLAPVGKIDL